uniref:Uncharacterized protein n=1 Tax=Rhizophora mucronata TaxID=61149 RepID=A0A2P2JDZ9_RHIMU
MLSKSTNNCSKQRQQDHQTSKTVIGKMKRKEKDLNDIQIQSRSQQFVFQI